MPRKIRHWTPRYVLHRIALAAYERSAPEAPWITRRACAYLDEWLAPEHVGCEWGSGRSTLWFAARVGTLYSVEHDPGWYQQVTAKLVERGAHHVEYRLARADDRDASGEWSYVRSAGGTCEMVDFALVDGIYRDRCAQLAMERLRVGGLLIIDNAEQFFTHPTHSPSALRRGGPDVSPLWREVRRKLSNWSCLWTTNGVFDTAIFTKPAQS